MIFLKYVTSEVFTLSFLALNMRMGFPSLTRTYDPPTARRLYLPFPGTKAQYKPGVQSLPFSAQ